MLQANQAGKGRTAPCPGLVDDAGIVRDACRVCGKCDDLIGDLMRDMVAAPAEPKQERTPAPAFA